MKSPYILLIIPKTPPFAGPEIAGDCLRKYFGGKTHYKIVTSNVRKDNATKGKMNAEGVFITFSLFAKIILALIKYRPQSCFTFLSSSKAGYLKDSMVNLICRLLGARVFTQYHGSNFLPFYERSSKPYKKYIRWTLKKTDEIITLGNAIIPQFKAIDDSLTVDVVPNGIDLEAFSPKDPNRSDRETHRAVNILFMGHLNFTKGFIDLVECYKILRRNHPDIRLYAAGEKIGHTLQQLDFLYPPFDSYYQSNMDRYDNIVDDFFTGSEEYGFTYAGFVEGERKKQLFYQSDFLVLPSYTEGLSYACLEALSAGLPIITTDTGAQSEIVVHGYNGYINMPGDNEKLLESMESLVSNEELRMKMATNSLKHREKFGMNLVYTRLEGKLKTS